MSAPPIPAHFTQLEASANNNAAVNIRAKRNELWLFNLPFNITVSDLEDIEFQFPTTDDNTLDAIQSNLPQHLKCLTIQSQQYCLFTESSVLAHNIVPLTHADSSDDYVPALPIQRTFKLVPQLHPCTYNHRYNQQQLQPEADFKLPTPQYAPTANPMFLPPKQINMVGKFKPVGYVGEADVHNVGFRRGIAHLKQQMNPKPQLQSPVRKVKKEKSAHKDDRIGSERKSKKSEKKKKHSADAEGSSKQSKKHKIKE